MKKLLYLFIGLGLLLGSCKSDDNGIDNPNDPNNPTNDNLDAQAFMWNALNLWYFWQADVDVLADDRFANDQEFTEFLEEHPNPSDLYFNTLLFSEDRFSFLNENYEELVNNLSGVSKSNGLEFGLVRFSEGNGLFGYVQYIVPNSDASTTDIKRGDIFTRVDGTAITLDNYVDLLFGDNDTYTLTLADINGTEITDNGTEIELTKIANQVEDPILVAETLDINGTKIAYLMYNRFLSNFNEELNAAFGQFVADGATELVLDMRYNPGGSVNTSRLLASMIYGTHTNDLYIRQRWNSKIQGQLSNEQLEDYFASSTGSTAINTLNLSTVYVLATNSSASASELVMNGLAPYVDVVHIGETTRGKNEFSITLVDDVDNSYIYNSDRESQINPDNSWGIQPLVGRNENADGFFDYTDGLAPNILLEEDLENLGVLGDPTEPLLARAIAEITGISSKKSHSVQMPAKAFTGSRIETPLRDNMYLDKPLHLNR
ncbi:S41 family peptidase [Flagellimonas algicola]|uniref:Carboxyl-terminal protease n=1 Tax=Flagellimonas algicola TaxID=2583815 RepID=A0ABY2WPP6_9FLAO|nr:S41 family peptidase [Allomuricauda algicola]TMU56888.1 carboxyl-terminal protease [Allomuricauda algicola]